MNSSCTVVESSLDLNTPNFLTLDDIFGKPAPSDAYVGLPHSELLYSNPNYYKKEKRNGWKFDVYYSDAPKLCRYLEEGIINVCVGGGYNKIYCGQCIWELYGTPRMKGLVPHVVSSSYSCLYKIVVEEHKQETSDKDNGHHNPRYCIKVIRMGVETEDLNIHKYFLKHMNMKQT